MQRNKWFLPMIASLFIGFSLASSFPDDAVVYAKEKKPIVICIDPGHGGVGGRNLGAQYNGISEKEVTLITANAMKNELEKYEGIQVYMTRTTDTEVSLDARAAYAKAVGADFLFSIHYNASPSHTIYGSEIWISAFGNEYKRGAEFGAYEQSELQSMGLYQRGIKTRLSSKGVDYYGILRASTALGIPSCIIEHAHLDHPVDLAVLSKNNSYVNFGIADATAVAKYYHLKSRILGVDYSRIPTINVKMPTVPVAGDTTPPEVCQINSAIYDPSKKVIQANMTASDSNGLVIYYAYSLDNGRSWSYLLPWDRNLKQMTVTIPANTAIPTLMVKAHNQYDKETISAPVSVSVK